MSSESKDSTPPGSAAMSAGSHALSLESTPHSELLGTLGRLARGLSVIFWCLPIAMVVCVQSAKGDWFRPLGVIPPLVATGLLFYGLLLLGSFQKQERIWCRALDRVKFVALLNIGLAPFLYWWNRIPSNPFFGVVIEAMMISGLLFLLLLNPMLARLTSMLPDETLRIETKMFTLLNRYLLVGLIALVICYFLLVHIDPGLPDRFIGWLIKVSPLPSEANMALYFLDRAGMWIVLFFVLLPLAMTMALLWKIKEVILASVFGPEH